MSAVLTEQQRRLAGLVSIGTVEQVQGGKVRVRMGGVLTDWLPMGGVRAGAIKVWNPLSVGEQVVLLAPSGDLGQAVAMPGFGSASNPTPEGNGNTFTVVFPDGASLTYDAAGGGLSFESPNPVKIKAPSVEIEAEIILKGSVTQTGGDITSDSDVIATGVSLVNHTHGGVMPGGSQTSPPTA